MIRQKGMFFWFTGNSGAGKTTITEKIEKLLNNKGIITYRIDGDNIRKGLNSDLGFSEKDREENVRRIAEVAKMFANFGIVTIVCTISPLIKIRNIARDILGIELLKEFYVKASLETCKERDPKGLYKNLYTKDNYIEYQEENANTIIINTEELNVTQSVNKAMIEIKKYL